MRTGPTLLGTQKLIIELKKLGNKEKAPIWKRVSEEMAKSTRTRREVALYKINKTIGAGEIALVPGKVLSNGDFAKKVTVAAFRFSEKAKEKITKAGGKAISIQQLIKENPKGKKVRIVG
jgi:large subunit ribosomal protein L18e